MCIVFQVCQVQELYLAESDGVHECPCAETAITTTTDLNPLVDWKTVRMRRQTGLKVLYKLCRSLKRTVEILKQCCGSIVLQTPGIDL